MLVIVFLPGSRHLLISWLWSPSAVILEPKKINCHFPLFPHLFAMKWWDWMPWSLFSECWVISQLFHSPFTFKRHFSSSSLSAFRVVSSGYLRLLMFLLAVLIPACASSARHFTQCTLHICFQISNGEIVPWGNKWVNSFEKEWSFVKNPCKQAWSFFW